VGGEVPTTTIAAWWAIASTFAARVTETAGMLRPLASRANRQGDDQPRASINDFRQTLNSCFSGSMANISDH